jgi:drug/metabolite transporter superfamily protein YnfA
MSIERGDRNDGRRIAVGAIAVVLLITSALMTFWPGQAGSANFVASASGRIGLVLAALWLAWPSLARPASWLPPGVAVLCVIALVVIATRPQLIVVAIPALAGLTALAALARTFRN